MLANQLADRAKAAGNQWGFRVWMSDRFFEAKRLWTLIACAQTLAFALAYGLVSSECSGADRPNIIYIMSDDMGYSDIGCYGSEIETPHLDKLASNGLRFTQFYNTARCCPTRASLLSGLYPHQAGIGHMMSDSGYEGYRGDLNRNCVTIAEVLKTAGYRTYMSGKWHVTKTVKPEDESGKSNWPRQRGFDRFYGTIHGAGSFFDPNSLTRDNELISPYADSEYQPENGFYYTDAIADHASRFVREHERDHSDEPFFMYVSFTAAHWPMHAREQDIEKYQGRYDAGYDAIRSARYRKMIELGVIDPSATQNFAIPEGSKENEFLQWDIRNMEVYGAMIDSMDQGIGQLIATLKENAQFENTVILFFQDNGGCAENYGRRGDGDARAQEPPLEPMLATDLQYDMQPKQTRDGYPVRTGKGVMAGAADTYIGYGKGWATVSNTPFREFKHYVHEGGISTPLIAHWPIGIRRTGQLEHTPGHLVDLMATAVDLAHADYPAVFHNDQSIHPMEGRSLRPLFEGQAIDREALYWEHEGNRAIRAGDWKLVAKGARSKWELYDMATDRSEQHDLAEQFPEKVQVLAAKWQQWAERARVLPLTPYRKKK
ncbi:MAG: arylsulfatase [Planctomycetota bacterium]